MAGCLIENGVVTNRLAQSTSTYLQQHADNPVDWWEWSEDAFAEARRRNVPVIISIGYSACHWCHVMAHESFEDPDTAAFMNEHFVNVKVDREERPDVDAVYMEVTQALTGHGGWPMTVFTDPDGRPFYAGTYFPPEPRHGMPSFPELLAALSEAWTQDSAQVMATGQRIVDTLAKRGELSVPAAVIDDGVLEAALANSAETFDPVFGGFGAAPKFPPSMQLEFLIRHAARTGSGQALAMAERTLEAMARGGMYDQLGGGFARYSVDAQWIVPHFEKMLYDNALLVRDYAHFWRLTGSPLAARIVRETITFMLSELRTPEGGFAAALDADSEGEEGKYYVWTPAELRRELGDEDGEWFASVASVTQAGTFEHGTSTLQLLIDPLDWERYENARSVLMRARSKRVRPARDDKVVAAWNGLAIAALAECSAIFDVPEWLDAALAAADVLLSVHLGVGDEGDRLVRTSRDGVPGAAAGVLEDYADVAIGFLSLYQVTGESEWLVFAGALIDSAVEHFADGDGGYFDTADDAEVLISRPRDFLDNATPSGWLSLTDALLTYAALTGSQEHRELAERGLRVVPAFAGRSARAVGTGLATGEALLAGPLEIAIVGEDTRPLRRVAIRSTSPGAVLAFGDDDVPLLRDRTPVSGLPTAYVCRGFVCEQPITDPSELAGSVSAPQGGPSE